MTPEEELLAQRAAYDAAVATGKANADSWSAWEAGKTEADWQEHLEAAWAFGEVVVDEVALACEERWSTEYLPDYRRAGCSPDALAMLRQAFMLGVLEGGKHAQATTRWRLGPQQDELVRAWHKNGGPL